MGEYDKQLFWITLVVCSIIAAAGIIAPENFQNTLSAAQGWISTNFAWMFLLILSVFIVFLLWVSMSRFGNVKLGKDDETPEYGFFPWIAMLFSCGIGIGFIFWAVAEPLYHYMQTPYLAEKATKAAEPVAMQISLLHWGIHGWACYAVAGLAIAYTTYRLGRPLTVANSLYGLLGERVNGPIGKAVDFLAAFATIAGISTSLGMGLLSIKFGISHLFGVDLGTTGLVFVMIALIVAYSISAATGIDKGIKYLSSANIWMALGVLIFLLFAGPTRYLLNSMVESVGSYASNFVFMTFWADSAEQSGWLGWWTVFYWCWWIAWAPFVGGFVARISRGRTIREFVVGVLLVPFVITVVWFNVVGGATLHAEITGAVNMWEAIQADAGSGIFTLLTSYPMGQLVSWVVFINLLVFLITSADSAAFFVAMIVTGGQLQPNTFMRLLWGAFIGAISVVLLIAGGLKGLQTASIIAALPFAFVMLGMMWSLKRLLDKEPIAKWTPSVADVRVAVETE